MSGGYTPGPWFVGQGGHHICAGNPHGDWQAVADSRPLLSAGFRPTAEQMANGFLISAAPELLEAVERARRHAMNIGITDGSYLAQLDAAIAKARGTLPQPHTAPSSAGGRDGQ